MPRTPQHKRQALELNFQNKCRYRFRAAFTFKIQTKFVYGILPRTQQITKQNTKQKVTSPSYPQNAHTKGCNVIRLRTNFGETITPLTLINIARMAVSVHLFRSLLSCCGASLSCRIQSRAGCDCGRAGHFFGELLCLFSVSEIAGFA